MAATVRSRLGEGVPVPSVVALLLPHPPCCVVTLLQQLLLSLDGSCVLPLAAVGAADERINWATRAGDGVPVFGTDPGREPPMLPPNHEPLNECARDEPPSDE